MSSDRRRPTVASLEIVSLGELATRAHYSPFAHLWWSDDVDDDLEDDAPVPFPVGYRMRARLRGGGAAAAAAAAAAGDVSLVRDDVDGGDDAWANGHVECSVAIATATTSRETRGAPGACRAWEGPTFVARWVVSGAGNATTRRAFQTASSLWRARGREESVVGTGTTPREALLAMAHARGIRDCCAFDAGGGKLAEDIFGFRDARTRWALKDLAAVAGAAAPRRLRAPHGVGLAIITRGGVVLDKKSETATNQRLCLSRQRHNSGYHDASSSWPSEHGEAPLVVGYQVTFELAVGVHVRCAFADASRPSSLVGARNGSPSRGRFVVEVREGRSLAKKARGDDPDKVRSPYTGPRTTPSAW